MSTIILLIVTEYCFRERNYWIKVITLWNTSWIEMFLPLQLLEKQSSLLFFSNSDSIMCFMSLFCLKTTALPLHYLYTCHHYLSVTDSYSRGVMGLKCVRNADSTQNLLYWCIVSLYSAFSFTHVYYEYPDESWWIHWILNKCCCFDPSLHHACIGDVWLMWE